MGELKLEVGKEYFDNKEDIWKVQYGYGDLFICSLESEDLVQWFSITGRSDENLFLTKEKPKPIYVWLNVYPSSCWTYSSREAADEGSPEERIGRIKLDLNELQGRWDD